MKRKDTNEMSGQTRTTRRGDNVLRTSRVERAGKAGAIPGSVGHSILPLVLGVALTSLAASGCAETDAAGEADAAEGSQPAVVTGNRVCAAGAYVFQYEGGAITQDNWQESPHGDQWAVYGLELGDEANTYGPVDGLDTSARATTTTCRGRATSRKRWRFRAFRAARTGWTEERQT